MATRICFLIAQRMLKEVERLNSEQKTAGKTTPVDEPKTVIEPGNLPASNQPQVTWANGAIKHENNDINGLQKPIVKNVNNLSDAFRSPVHRLFFYL